MKKPDGGSAFPTGGTHTHRDGSVMSVDFRGGMTLRDYFAGQALVGTLSLSAPLIDTETVVADAYAIADAMLAEREKA